MSFHPSFFSRSRLLVAIAPLLFTQSAPNPILPANFSPERSASIGTSFTIAQAVSQGNELLDAGQQHYQKGQLRDALATYQQALATFRQTGGDAAEQLRKGDGEGTAIQMIGLIYARLGQYQNGLDSLQEALQVQQAVQDRAAKTEGETALQIFFRSRGKLRSTLSFLALIHERLAQYPKALDLSLEAIARSGRSPGDYALDGEIFNQLGKVYANQTQFPKALEAYYRAMVLVEEVGYPLGRDISKGGRPINVIEANKLIYGLQPISQQAAMEYLERSLKLNYHAPPRMHPWARFVYVTTLNNLGDAYRRMGRSQAQFFYLKALEASRFAQSLELEALSLNNVGLGYTNTGQINQAQEYYQQALAVSRKLGDRALEGKSLNNLGSAFLQAKNYPQASESLTAALTAWESLRPGLSDTNLVSLFETQVQAYEQLQTALVAQNKVEQALEIAERGRARAFVELLARRLKPVEAAKSTVQPLTLTQIRQVAKTQKATLVEYSIIGNETLYIWVVKPDGTIVFRQVSLRSALAANRDNLADYIEAVRLVGLGVRGRGTVPTGGDRPTSTQLQQLYQLLIAPVADQLPQEPGARIVFIPHNALFLVPFAALQNPSGKYLIEQYTIAISPSIQVLQLTQQQGHRQQPVSDRAKTLAAVARLNPALIVGNPAMPKIRIVAGEPPEQLSSLPGAEIEAMAIASLLQTSALIGKQATEQTVVQQLPTQRLIHLATHGLLDDFKGLGVPGAIALAPDANSPSSDGLLTANEILDLKLNADLVVLSACDTGRGRITGDGVIGLSRSLLSAGSSSVIVSLWAVSDASTALLMTEFYQALLQNPDKAIALRQAMLKTLQQYPTPRDWAAFVFIGAAE
ncbi:MAG: CHAT domain-containing tetratricopeptide repeat protein [Leptolyngbyaceae cyanobacterium bins.302]|nr:CHAT domain-containing tetratricopeptide repeat protein [Leptolyngbyaceae cyanobacterium bins.302]